MNRDSNVRDESVQKSKFYDVVRQIKTFHRKEKAISIVVYYVYVYYSYCVTSYFRKDQRRRKNLVR